ncbi:MAG: preprotein translocase subunit SecG [Spirochaetales bacterium]|nr:preprotein translocase subunit SecG [Spirochaetales bacterium]
MGALGIVFVVIMVITGLLLGFFVLIQDDQGDGMGGVFGGSSTSAFGSRAGNALTKMTSTLGMIFILSALVVAFDIKRQHDSSSSTDVTSASFVEAYESSLEDGDWYGNNTTSSEEGELDN